MEMEFYYKPRMVQIHVLSLKLVAVWFNPLSVQLKLKPTNL
jgi:hypothetical protein